MMEDDEVMLEFNSNNNEKESELFKFLEIVIEKSVGVELDIPHEDH